MAFGSSKFDSPFKIHYGHTRIFMHQPETQRCDQWSWFCFLEIQFTALKCNLLRKKSLCYLENTISYIQNAIRYLAKFSNHVINLKKISTISKNPKKRA